MDDKFIADAKVLTINPNYDILTRYPPARKLLTDFFLLTDWRNAVATAVSSSSRQ